MPVNLSEEQQLRIIMTFGFDQAKAQQVVQGLRAVGSSTKEMADSIQKASGVSQPFAQQMTSELRAAVNIQQAYNKEVERGRQFRQDELNDLKQMGVLIRGQQSVSGRGMGPGFAEFMLAMSLRSIPGMQGSPVAEGIMGASSINSAISMFQNMAKEAGGAGQAALAVAKSLGPVTIGFTAMTVILSEMQRIVTEGNAGIKAGVEQLKEFYTAIETGTTETIQKDIALLKVKYDAETETMAVLKDKMDKMLADANARRAGQGLAPIDVTTDIGQRQALIDIDQIANEPLRGLLSQFNALKGETDGLSGKMTALKDAMGNVDVKANDAAAAIVKEAERKNQMEKQISADYAMTSDAATRRVSTLLEDEKTQYSNIAAYTAAMNTVKEGTPQYLDYKAKLEAAQQALQNDKDEVKTLTTVIIPLIEEREREAQAAEAQSKAYADLRSELDKARTAVDEAKASIEELDAEYAAQQELAARDALRQAARDKEEAMWQARIDNAKAAEEAAAAEEKLAKIRRDAEAEIARLIADEADKEAKMFRDHAIDMYRMWQDFYIESTRAYEDYLIQRRRDEEDMADTLRNDAADRNVLAFIRDKEEAEKKMQREWEDYELSSQRRIEDYSRRRQEEEEDFNRRLADMREALAKEMADRRAALAQRLADEVAGSIQRNTESQRLQKMFDDIRHQWQLQDEARKQADELASYQRRRQTLIEHLIEMEAAYANFKFRMEAMMNGSQTGNNQPGYAPGSNPFATISSQSSVTNNVNMNIAAGATSDFVNNLLGGFGRDIISALRSA